MTLEEYKARSTKPGHPLVASHYFTKYLFMMDLMHCMGCQGVTSIVFGSIMLWHIRNPSFGANQQQRLAHFNKELKQWYDQRPGSIRLPEIELTNIMKDGWANLSGQAIKSAMTKGAVPFFADYADCHLQGKSVYEGCMRDVVKGLHKFNEILAGQGMFMSPSSLRRLRDCCATFGSDFMRCRALAEEQSLPAWHITTKVHKMQHLPAIAKIVNPKRISCYVDEAAIGSTTTVWKKAWAADISKRYSEMF